MNSSPVTVGGGAIIIPDYAFCVILADVYLVTFILLIMIPLFGNAGILARL